MTLRQAGWIVATTVFISIAAPLWASSYYTQRPDDPQAVYLTRGDQGVRGDGISDDSNAIQQAIDRVQETTAQGIVFIPEGRLSHQQDHLCVAREPQLFILTHHSLYSVRTKLGGLRE